MTEIFFIFCSRHSDWRLVVVIVWFFQIWNKKERNIIISRIISSHFGSHINWGILYIKLMIPFVKVNETSAMSLNQIHFKIEYRRNGCPSNAMKLNTCVENWPQTRLRSLDLIIVILNKEWSINFTSWFMANLQGPPKYRCR